MSEVAPVQWIRSVDFSKFDLTKVSSQILADRETGVESIRIHVSCLRPGESGPGMHIHPFDQFIYVLRGAMGFEMGAGGEEIRAEADSLVFIPQGLPHRLWNANADEEEVHMNLAVPQPQPGEQGQIPV